MGLAVSYAVRFRQIASKLDWSDKTLIARFYDGLKDSVKDDLCKANRPDRLNEYVEMVVRIDERLYERI